MKKFNIGNYKLPHMTPLKNNHTGGWNSQVVGSAGGSNKIKKNLGEGHDRSKRFTYDPADKARFEALTQKQKDSLQGQAYKFGKPFFSPELGVNVDPEDGVLSNRPVYSDNTKLTYDPESKPIEDLVKQAYSKRRDDYMSMVGKKKHKMLPPQTKEQAEREFMSESYSTKFNPETRQIENLVSSNGDGAISEEELAKVPSYLRNPFQQ